VPCKANADNLDVLLLLHAGRYAKLSQNAIAKAKLLFTMADYSVNNVAQES